MISLTDKELRTIDFEFRTRAGRVMGMQFRDAVGTLRQFMDYVDGTPILADYVRSCNLPISEAELDSDIQSVANGFGKVQFKFPYKTDEELAQLNYIIRKCLNTNNDKEAFGALFAIGRAYDSTGSIGNYQASVEAFIHAIAQRFIDDLNLYLHSITMNIKIDSERSYNIQNNGGQVVIANDNAMVTATQNNYFDDRRFSELEKGLLDTARENGLAQEHLKEIDDILTEIKEQLQAKKQNKTVLGGLLASLEKIVLMVKGCEALIKRITELKQFIMAASGIIFQ
jgi:hypothetical protein